MTPWDTLGIEPTNDIRAIKKAYSVKLKTTRPDDDAAAYQQLREAYEAAQQWAQYMDFEEAEDAPAPAEPPPPVGEPVVVEEASPEAVQGITLERLLQTCTAILEQGGAQHLMRRWPGLQQQLEDLPIGDGPAANQGFARFVLQREDVPTAVLVALTQHFQWGLDYRANHQLGPTLAVPLQDKLHQAHVYAALHGSTEPSDEWPMALARMWTSKRKLWARFLSICLDPMTRQEARQVPAARLDALGADGLSAKAAVRLVASGGGVQFVVLTLLVFVLVAIAGVLGLSNQSWIEIGTPAVFIVPAALLYALLYQIVEDIDTMGGRFRRWITAHDGLIDSLPLVPLAVALLSYLDVRFHWLNGRSEDAVAFVYMWLGYGLIWAFMPTEHWPWRKLMLPVFLVLVTGLYGFFPTLTHAMVMSLAFAWTMAAHVVLTRFAVVFEVVCESLGELSFLHKIIFLYFGIKLILISNLVLLAILALFCLPVFLFRLMAQRGALYAHLAIVAGATLGAAITPSRQYLLLPVWVLASALAIQLVQTGGQALAEACLRKLRMASNSAL